jgi:small GTP-binding protein
MAAATIRIIVIGDSSVGKTQMMMRFCDDSFSLAGQTTVGVDFKAKQVSIDGVPYKAQIWDTAGQERFRNIVENYYRRAQGIVLVYDVTRKDTFTSLPQWLQSIDQYANPGTPVILAGNKSDLTPAVECEEAESFAADRGLTLFLTSAANGEGIEDAFLSITQKAVSGASKPAPGPGPPTPQPASSSGSRKGMCMV